MNGLDSGDFIVPAAPIVYAGCVKAGVVRAGISCSDFFLFKRRKISALSMLRSKRLYVCLRTYASTPRGAIENTSYVADNVCCVAESPIHTKT